jgi:pimeloyl-ACP methyl ester carboxylesterase
MAERRRRLVSVLLALTALAGVSACGGGGRIGSGPTVPTTAAPPLPTATARPTGTATTPPATVAPAVRWSACEGAAGPAGYQCATVMVPRDPAHPDAGQIGMAIDRRAATGRKIGSLLVNPGGPGVSGVDFLPYVVATMPADLRASFDIVGFDPPGVDRTAPIICEDSTGLDRYFSTDPEPQTSSGFAALVAVDRTLASGCEARNPAELSHVSTVDAAGDMDVLRAALGDARLTYLGFSYGSLLGATYAGLFPTHIRAMVLDGVLDPALPALAEIDQQSEALDAQLQAFFAMCAQSGCAWHPDGDPTAAFEALVARARAHPLPAEGTSRPVGPAAVLWGAAETLYSPATWPQLAQSLQAATDGDGTDFLALSDEYVGRSSHGAYSNILEANAAVNCLDTPAPSLAAIQANAPLVRKVAPVFGLLDLYGAVQCTVWPVPATGTIGPIRASGSPPIVVVGSTGDPVTPYAWAQSLSQELAGGVLLTRVGDGHTAYASSACIRAQVDRYLISLTVPPAGTRCPSDNGQTGGR